MLTIKKTRSAGRVSRWIWGVIGVVALASGCYILSLVLAPTVSLSTVKPIKADSLKPAAAGDNRVIIPKIGVNIPYGSDGVKSLDEGAWWRYPERGNPEKGGNFIIAAHRFSIQPTPGETIIKSPFYHIDKISLGDQVLVDYNGKRYGYTIDKIFNVKPNQTEIEAPIPNDQSRLTLYSCDLGGSAEGRVVLYGKPLGHVQIK